MIRVNVRQRPDRAHLQLAYTDPLTGAVRTKSAGTKNWKAAERAASVWESELQQVNGQRAIGWDIFRQRFEDEHLPTLAAKSQKHYMYSLDKFAALMGRPRDIRLIDASLTSQFRAKLRANLPSENSVKSVLNGLRSALGWAAATGIIPAAPRIRIGKIGKRGRAITIMEFTRYLQRAKQDQFGDSLVRLLKIMWLGGLRVSEAIKLDMTDGPVRVDFKSKHPSICWKVGGHKSRRVERTPLTPDFARFLSRFKSGNVSGCPFAQSTIETRLGELGEGFTAHDLRRTFGTRWALRVHPLVLQKMMRHKSIETTLSYYVDLAVDDIGDQIWNGVHGPVHSARAPQPKIKFDPTKTPGKNHP